jgi:cytidylate kinase
MNVCDLCRKYCCRIGRCPAPLTAADDAIAIDTTHLTLDQVIDLISELALERA